MEKLVLTNSSIASIKKNLIEGLTIASGARSSATYYHSRDEQTKAVRDQISKLYGQSKELPLIVAAQKGVTGMFASEVLLNELKNTTKGGACNIVNPIDWYDNGLNDKALLTVLNNLNNDGITYVLRLFMELKKSKVNNERTRKIVLGFLLGNSNLEWNCLKYRNKIASVLGHVYGKKKTSVLLSIASKFVNSNVYTNEKESSIANDLFLKYYNGDAEKGFKLLLFLFKKDKGVKYLKSDFPLIFEYQKAKKDITSVTMVPEEVLIGLISNKNHPQHEAMWTTDANKETTKAKIREKVKVTSVNQQVRQTKSSKKLGVEKEVNLSKATDFLALYKTGYENGFNDDLKKAIEDLAESKKIDNFYYSNIGVILDDSNSMRGHSQESKNTPKAIAHFTTKVLGYSAIGDKKLVKTKGMTTDLATSFVELLKKENQDNPYDAIFIITDGYENSYDGLTNEVISTYIQATNRNIPIFQISPIVSAEMGANVRNIGDNVIKMAISNPAAIQPQISARLLEIDTKLWLEGQILSLSESSVSRKVKKSVNV